MTDREHAARCFASAKADMRRALEYRAQAKGRPKRGNGKRATCRALACVATSDAIAGLAAALAWRGGAHRDQPLAMLRREAIAADADRVACAAGERLRR